MSCTTAALNKWLCYFVSFRVVERAPSHCPAFPALTCFLIPSFWFFKSCVMSLWEDVLHHIKCGKRSRSHPPGLGFGWCWFKHIATTVKWQWFQVSLVPNTLMSRRDSNPKTRVVFFSFWSVWMWENLEGLWHLNRFWFTEGIGQVLLHIKVHLSWVPCQWLILPLIGYCSRLDWQLKDQFRPLFLVLSHQRTRAHWEVKWPAALPHSS